MMSFRTTSGTIVKMKIEAVLPENDQNRLITAKIQKNNIKT